MPAQKLTPKQERFVAEYLIDLNATAAYKRAGYAGKGKSAEASASEILGNLKVAAAVKAAIEKRSSDLGIDASYVLSTIKETIDRCRQVHPVLDKKGDPVMVVTPSGDIVPAFMFDAANVLKGADLLARHVGLYEKDNKQQQPTEIYIAF
ncbi:MAG: terminase small subunit [Rhodocyclaceae bacterium]|nr:terminase small subunit [Rhodocyclaceae bacterium]